MLFQENFSSTPTALQIHTFTLQIQILNQLLTIRDEEQAKNHAFLRSIHYESLQFRSGSVPCAFHTVPFRSSSVPRAFHTVLFRSVPFTKYAVPPLRSAPFCSTI